MSTACLITEAVFRGAGIVPTTRSSTIVPDGFSWNYTTYLNFVFIALFGVLYWLYRSRGRMGEGARPGGAVVCEKHGAGAHT
jgi:hypothetical protein